MESGLDDQQQLAPLAAFGGAVPPAPPWFTAALADVPERHVVVVNGSMVELLTWGEAGKPGLLLLHGNGAHADWWDFIAPFFAADYRVAALSWSGMGGSAHREHYDLPGFVAQIFACSEAAGLFASKVKPVIVGHSFGGLPMMTAAATAGERLKAAVIVDSPFRQMGQGRPPNATDRPHRIYTTLAEALARFRFAPLQSAPNAYIVDHIARGSLIEVPGGWQWRFDPYLWSRFDFGTPTDWLAKPGCPVALIWGERSALLPPEMVRDVRGLLPPGAQAFGIPGAAHHVMVDQPLAFVSALRGLLAGWPG